MKGTLYLVSIPIGNENDITLRALKILKEVDFIICEEYKVASKFLRPLEIKKPLEALNEHTEQDVAENLAMRVLNGETAAVISDCGTPVFSDPGNKLVSLCIDYGINVVPVPGANSLLPALVGSGFPLNSFYYRGWLSPNKQQRRQELHQLKNTNELLVIMETPYRLRQLLTDIVSKLGAHLPAVVAFKLTMPQETFYRGTTKELLDLANKKTLKGEFVLIIDNRKK